MTRKSISKPQKENNPIMSIWEGVLILLFFILWLLIKIGDSVKWIVQFLLKTVCHILNSIKPLKITLPKLSHLALPGFKFPSLPQIKFTLPRFHFPNISLPQISLPEFKLPQIPKFTIPRPPSFPTTYYSLLTTKFKWFLSGIIFTLIFILVPYWSYLWLSTLPNPQLLSVKEIPVTTKIYDRNGYLLYEIYTDQNRTPVLLSDIPKTLKEATIAIEDKEFYNHPGFSIKGILRAAKETIINHRLQGGSTITQQLVRSALLTPEPTINRKLKEILLSFWAERLFTKDKILEMYFNQVPYGGTAWGVEAASQTFFSKSVKDLSLAEATYLAALPASPSVFSPFGTHPEEGLIRQKEVLRAMVDQGFISNEQRNQAELIKLAFQPPKTEIKAPHFVMYIKDLLEKKYGPRLTQMGGLRIITSLDLPIQEMAQEIVTNEVNNLTPLKVGNGAALITNPKTGEIMAMVGSKNYYDTQNDGNVNVSLSLRQPGSSIKVVNYALALEKTYTAASTIDDSPINYQIPDQPIYSPVNYDGKYHGRITLRTALASSFNIPAVKVLASLGVKNMITKGKQMGITSWTDENRYGLSLTLGGGEVTMLDMARVYNTLADGGQGQNLVSILQVTNYKGQILEQALSQQKKTAVSSGVAFILSQILADNNARTPTFGPTSLLNVPKKTVAVKTGTSNDLRDNWAIGFTPSYVVTVWVGNNDNSPMSYVASGVTGATPIWQKIMINLLKDKPDEPFVQPAEVIKTSVCGLNEYFIKGSEKFVLCPPPPSPSPTP